MKMDYKISNRALINSIYSVQNEIKRIEKLNRKTTSEKDLQTNGEILLELQRTFGELCQGYKQRCKSDQTLPSLNQLLNSDKNARK